MRVIESLGPDPRGQAFGAGFLVSRLEQMNFELTTVAAKSQLGLSHLLARDHNRPFRVVPGNGQLRVLLSRHRSWFSRRIVTPVASARQN